MQRTFSKPHIAKFLFMRWVSFLSRVAFICNLAFGLSVLLQWKPFVSNPALLSTIVVTGYFLAPFIFNPVANLFCLAMLLRKKPLTSRVPNWLALANFGFLIIQIVFVLFFLHDPFHT